MASKETKRKKKYEPSSKKQSGTKLTKDERLDIIDKIQDKYLRHGTINKSELARELKISRKTMMSLVNELSIETESLDVTKLEIKLIFDRMKQRLLFLWDKLIEQSESTEQINVRAELQIMKEMKDTLNNFYSMLQEFGEAPKQAQDVNLKGLIVHAEVNVEDLSKQILGN